MTEYLDVLFLAVGYAVGWYIHRPKAGIARLMAPTDPPPPISGEDGRFLVTCGETIVYCGSRGADARKHVERARASGESGEFYDGDVRRDWWPR